MTIKDMIETLRSVASKCEWDYTVEVMNNEKTGIIERLRMDTDSMSVNHCGFWISLEHLDIHDDLHPDDPQSECIDSAVFNYIIDENNNIKVVYASITDETHVIIGDCDDSIDDAIMNLNNRMYKLLEVKNESMYDSLFFAKRLLKAIKIGLDKIPLSLKN